MHRAAFTLLLLISLIFQGCALPPTTAVPPSPVDLSTPLVSASPTVAAATPSPMPTPSAQPETTPAQTLRLWVSPQVPTIMSEPLSLPAWVQVVTRREAADLFLEIPRGGTSSMEQTAGEGRYILALAAPFPTLADGINSADLKRAWQGRPPKDFAGAPLLMSRETLDLLSTWWGAPAPGSTRVLEASRLLESAWQSSPSWAIVPFEAIEPRWKVLRVGGISPLDRDFDESAYPLAVPVSVTGSLEAVQSILERSGGPLSLSGNRDPQKLTVLVMTGVTALARGTARTMEQEGVTYPGRDIREWLSGADLTHISNEVSFADDCPPGRPDARFCSPTRYIDLLKLVGTDIVELTGNHNNDWGPGAYNGTLALYRELGWGVYGGGATPAEARRPLEVAHNGNRLVFLGCNIPGPAGAWAGPYQPGAAECDFDALEKEIARLAQAGSLPIVTLQAFETDNYRPEVAQAMPVFRRMAAAGAVIVSGSQSHYPQTMTFVGQSFVHYGLGNLFFDQMDLLATRQAFIDRHVFYEGRYLGVELLTTLLEDAARPRPMTLKERAELLERIFNLSTWEND